MKFTAQVSYPSLLQTICRNFLQKGKSYMEISENGIKLSMITDEEKSAMAVSQLERETFFDSYVFSNSHGSIFLQFNGSQLYSVLQRSSAMAELKTDRLVMKLTRKNNFAYLSIKLSLMGVKDFSGNESYIIQDIPVSLMRDAVPFNNMSINPHAEGIVFHLDRPVKIYQISEKYKSMSQHVTLTGEPNGSLTLAVEAEGLQVSTTWSGLETVSDPQEPHSVTISPQNWSNALHATLSSRSVSLKVRNEELVVVQFELDEGIYVMYYITHRDLRQFA
ncbi:hypothetical protein TRVA0_052S01200 [Trichomonascus vanleenenianus]|uniref:uncharacterized protein n=1 Tax=Trichomonascus vanleenenianus TaxID=2268995 RepID=UPI003ECB1BD1